MRKIKLCLLAIGVANLVQAQTEIALQPLSITSNRLLQKTKESGRNITVITGDAFNHLPNLSLDELLNDL
jgi:outer membrane cobalamin receptor